MNRFTAYRKLDISDTHNENQMNDPSEPQYQGCVFESGKCVIQWLTAVSSVSVFDTFEQAMLIHGHPEYGTEIEFHDEVLPLPWDQ